MDVEGEIDDDNLDLEEKNKDTDQQARRKDLYSLCSRGLVGKELRSHSGTIVPLRQVQSHGAMERRPQSSERLGSQQIHLPRPRQRTQKSAD